ncbi:glycosyltransferase family 4 protein [Planktotalea sp.]|uniref:glycosyltransferase family 4 protein n=1 Tax=Planktotalea sp. TaxID=2029877 RepID=UPI003C739F2F
MKIAYLCDISPLNTNLYSGGNARIYRALQRQAGEVTIIGNSWGLAEPVRRLMHMLPERINLRLRWRLHLVLGRIISLRLRRELIKGDYDVLFCAYSFQSLAGLGSVPGVVSAFTTDATPTIFKNSVIGKIYGSGWSLSRYFDPWITKKEQQVLADTDLLFIPSEWLRSGIKSTFEIDRETICVIPWGANVFGVEPPEFPNPLRADAPVELLFVGRNWFAKGGQLALDALRALEARGHAARLTILGCTPRGIKNSDTVKVIPQLDKSNDADLAAFEDLFRKAHFLINPSMESYGFAFCEASAYGLPSLALRAGGIPIRDGVNGHALPVGSTGEDFAAVISEYLANPQAHEKLRESSRKEYDERLNWDTWGKAVAIQLRRAVDAQR